MNIGNETRNGHVPYARIAVAFVLLISVPVCVATGQNLELLNASQLHALARASYNDLEFLKCAIYLYAYVQSRPPQMRDKEYADKIRETYEYARALARSSTTGITSVTMTALTEETGTVASPDQECVDSLHGAWALAEWPFYDDADPVWIVTRLEIDLETSNPTVHIWVSDDDGESEADWSSTRLLSSPVLESGFLPQRIYGRPFRVASFDHDDATVVLVLSMDKIGVSSLTFQPVPECVVRATVTFRYKATGESDDRHTEGLPRDRTLELIYTRDW